MRHIIRPAVEPLGYEPTRADDIAQPGIITSQVIQHIVDDDLVIADLTDRNPNVFYELAIRHAIARPFVQVTKSGEDIPFDVAGTRTVFIDLQDPDSVASAKSQIVEQIKTLEEKPSDLETPITVAIDLQRLRGSEKPDERLIAELLATVTETRRGESQIVEILSMKLDEIERSILTSNRGSRSPIPQQIKTYLVRDSSGAYDFVVAVSGFRDAAPWIYEIGMEVFRRAVAGDIERARQIYSQMESLIRWTRRLLPESLMEIAELLPMLFERILRPPRQRREKDDDLPF